MSYTRTEAAFLEILRQVCHRPALIVGRGGFDTVAAFLSGVDWGIRKLHPEESDPTGMGYFHHWLVHRYRDRCDGMGNLGWAAYVRALYPDDAVLYVNLPDMFVRSLLDREHDENWPIPRLMRAPDQST